MQRMNEITYHSRYTGNGHVMLFALVYLLPPIQFDDLYAWISYLNSVHVLGVMSVCCAKTYVFNTFFQEPFAKTERYIPSDRVTEFVDDSFIYNEEVSLHPICQRLLFMMTCPGDRNDRAKRARYQSCPGCLRLCTGQGEGAWDRDNH